MRLALPRLLHSSYPRSAVFVPSSSRIRTISSSLRVILDNKSGINKANRHTLHTTALSLSASSMAPTDTTVTDNIVTQSTRPIVISGPSGELGWNWLNKPSIAATERLSYIHAGTGKSTLLKKLFDEYPDTFGFSVSRRWDRSFASTFSCLFLPNTQTSILCIMCIQTQHVHLDLVKKVVKLIIS